MSSKVARGTAILERIKDKTGMTEAGKNWLIAAIDPNHDVELQCTGYPDRNSNPSVVQVIKQTFSVTQPSSYTTDPWGFHLMIDDYLCNGQAWNANAPGALEVSQQNLIIDLDVSAPDNQLPYGGLSIIKFDGPAGREINHAPPTGSGVENYVEQHQIDPANFLNGKTRLISQAFEIINTSAELYKGGSIMCYEQPGSKQDPVTFNVHWGETLLSKETVARFGEDNIYVEEAHEIEDFSLSEAGSKSCEEISYVHKLKEIKIEKPVKHKRIAPKRYFVYDKGVKKYLDTSREDIESTAFNTWDDMPPRNLAEADILPGTQQWDAQDGCYCVQAMNDMENPPSFPTQEGSLYVTDELTTPRAGSVSGFSRDIYEAIPVLYQRYPFNLVEYQYNKKTPFNRKGAIVYGLTPQSTFTINYTVILERFVSSQDQNLATLAKPSPPEDYIATELYSTIVNKMPIGTKFKDNDMGEWFLGMVDQIANVVSTIGKPVMSAVDMYQTGRNNTASRGTNYLQAGNSPAKQLTRATNKALPAGKMRGPKKAGGTQMIQGPKMQNGSFTTKTAKNAKKKQKKAKAKAAAGK